MRKIVVSFLGRDCPGVLHSVADLLCGLDCNIEEITQTILQTEFAMILIATLPDGLEMAELDKRLAAGLEKYDMSYTLREFGEDACAVPRTTQPFVVTLNGQDRRGIIAGISGVLARFGVNIENLKAVPREDAAGMVVIGFEIALPDAVDLPVFRRTLKEEAARLGMDATLQHRDIFEAMHRVQPL
ncbi:glycine cleavage system transcriptional repressor [Desulfobaculum xiamenense]|uniref:Glycine cleavage system transcriptional repressor n=1 Tax=Desulfobaculum xiamenense TaxID=995050 RepID=A0A846QJC9_9BACT|nr:ACT domain-containing protein [Desulfobaculum xiamenense]NJB68338.1 glycine cleavage system transcriptional repressor [Desulfobaculum xiamenense]